MGSDLKLEVEQILKTANKEAQMKPSHIKVAIKEYVPHFCTRDLNTGLGILNWAWDLNTGLVYLVVVSTVASCILFARFPTVECIAKVKAFYVMTSLLFQKVPVKKESSLSMGGAFIFLALFPQNYIHL